MEPLTFDSSDVGLIEATVSKLSSKLDIGAVGSCTRAQITRRVIAPGLGFDDLDYSFDIGYSDIACAACVTPRAVQLAFRRHLDTTPLAYRRRVRLHHARQDLAQASPGDGTTVTTVAYRWGFTSPSRFAAAYRAAYGVLPSDTLSRLVPSAA